MSVMNVAGRTRSASPTDSGFQHEAMLYSGQEQFVDRTARFVRAGLRAGEPVLVAVIEPRAELLRRELGQDAEQVEFLDMQALGRNPARIIPAWQEWVGQNAGAGPGLRAVGEPVWAARTAAELTECEQHELLLALAFGDGPGWRLICPYDTATLAAEVVGRVCRTHALTSEGDEPRTSPEYPHPETTIESVRSSGLPEPGAVAHQMDFGRDHLGGVRRAVAGQAGLFGLVGQRGEDLVLVASELASNSVRHGGGEGRLRMWREGGDLVCEVRDRGYIADPLVGRRRPAIAAAEGGAGLWMTNQLCDLVQIRSSEQSGTVVRVRIALPHAPAAPEPAGSSDVPERGPQGDREDIGGPGK